MIAQHLIGAGDFFGAPYPTGYNLATYITPLQGYMPDKVIAALAKACDALEPGGTGIQVEGPLTDRRGLIEHRVVLPVLINRREYWTLGKPT